MFKRFRDFFNIKPNKEKAEPRLQQKPKKTYFVWRDKRNRELEFFIQNDNSFAIELFYQGKKVGKMTALLWMEFHYFEWEIQQFLVEEEYRQQGFGTALGEFFMEYAKTASDCLWIDIPESAFASQALAKKLGFTNAGDDPSYWEYEFPRKNK